MNLTKNIIFIPIFVLILGFSLAAVISLPKTNNQKPSPAGKVVGTSISNQTSPTPETPSEKTSLNKAKVTRVIDGDTIEISAIDGPASGGEDGQKIRYIGIDAPETTKSVDCFGKEATDINRLLVENKIVSLEKDVTETDKYGRLLRYVFIDDPSSGSGQVFVNDYLIRQGYANSYTYPPDIKYQDQLTQAEQEARQENRGLWASCFDENNQLVKPDCVIKGNISFRTGEKIYHLPGQKYYDKTAIDQNAGERWFCTEEEAQTAGWRKSKN